MTKLSLLGGASVLALGLIIGSAAFADPPHQSDPSIQANDNNLGLGNDSVH